MTQIWLQPTLHSFINNVVRDVYDKLPRRQLYSHSQTSRKRNTRHRKTANMLLLISPTTPARHLILIFLFLVFTSLINHVLLCLLPVFHVLQSSLVPLHAPSLLPNVLFCVYFKSLVLFSSLSVSVHGSHCFTAPVHL